MKPTCRFLVCLFVASFALPSFAQLANSTRVTAERILVGDENHRGIPVAFGTICAEAVSVKGYPLKVTAPGWPETTRDKKRCGRIVGGKITDEILVPDARRTSSRSPIYYSFTIQQTDESGNPIGHATRIKAVPSVIEETFELDKYKPAAAVALSAALVKSGTPPPTTCNQGDIWISSSGVSYLCSGEAYTPFGLPTVAQSPLNPDASVSVAVDGTVNTDHYQTDNGNNGRANALADPICEEGCFTFIPATSPSTEPAAPNSSSGFTLGPVADGTLVEDRRGGNFNRIFQDPVTFSDQNGEAAFTNTLNVTHGARADLQFPGFYLNSNIANFLGGGMTSTEPDPTSNQIIRQTTRISTKRHRGSSTMAFFRYLPVRATILGGVSITIPSAVLMEI